MTEPGIEHAANMLPQLFTLVGAMLIICFYAGKLIKKTSLPSLIGYMLVGALFGPSFKQFGLELFTGPVRESLAFITQVALGFVAFSIGAELSMKSLKRLGNGIVWIIFSESFAAFFVVTGLIYAVSRDLPMALIFGSMAPASAPARTVAIIQEYKAKGSLTQALYAVVGFDDGLAIIIFGFAAADDLTITLMFLPTTLFIAPVSASILGASAIVWAARALLVVNVSSSEEVSTAVASSRYFLSITSRICSTTPAHQEGASRLTCTFGSALPCIPAEDGFSAL